MWTQFMDMHSGGKTKKEPYNYIYIEAKDDEAVTIFYNRFGRNPSQVTCTCCGEDYSISESKSLQEATGFHRNCEYVYFDTKGREVSEKQGFVIGKGMRRGYSCGYIERQDPSNMDIRKRCATPDSDKWGLYQTLKEYLKKEDVLVVYAKDIKTEERKGEVLESGYVWVD